MKNQQAQSNEHISEKVIHKRVLSQMKGELGQMYTVKWMKEYSACIVARAPFTLGLIIANLYSNFMKNGISWDTLKVDVKTLTMKITIHPNNALSRMRVEFQ